MIDPYPPPTAPRAPTPNPRPSDEPLVGSDWWNGTKCVVWDTLRYSLLAEAARALDLRIKRHPDGMVSVWTTASDLLLIAAYVQRRNELDHNA